MAKIKLTIELDYNSDIMHGDDKEAQEWFFKDVLGRDQLFLHSNEIGDEVGNVNVLEVLTTNQTEEG